MACTGSQAVTGRIGLISVHHRGRVRFFLPMAGTFMALVGAWLTVRNGGILKVLNNAKLRC